MSDSAFDANKKAIIERLTTAHGFELTPEDIRSITHVLVSFFEAGPNINYGYRSTAPNFMQAMYATFAQLQSLTNAEGVNMAFLANEANYRVLRTMHRKNLIIPVVGDFAGPKAIRGVGDWIKQRHAVVSAFYLSNVEQFLFQDGKWNKFCSSVASLPIDDTSMFIRSGRGRNSFGGGVQISSAANMLVDLAPCLGKR